jgi:protein-tyrosine kinase
MLGLKNRFKKKKSKLDTMGRKLITISDSKSIIAEQFRTIRTNISFSVTDTDSKTILVTSSTRGEGKSTNTANLGVAFAQEGKNVLIVDADMRIPTLHHTFDIFNTVGLSTILSKQDEFNRAIQETPIVGLHVLPSGPIPPNPAELLSSITFSTFLEEMKKVYNIIIFDAPPLLSVSDAQILSHQCDGTLLIIHSGVAEKEDVVKAKYILTSSQAKILGVVLNQYKMPRKQEKKYHYQ